MKPPLKEKPLNGESWTKPWHTYFDGISNWVTGLITALKFTDLTDVPSSYTGQAGKVVKVKGTEDGLEFGTGGISDHTLLTNIGTSTHPQLDTERSNSISHRADATIHFTQAQIDHVNLLNKGTNTHTQLDNEKTSSEAHRADTLIHFEQADIDHTAIDNIGIYTHDELDIEKDLSVLHRADDEIHNLDYDERVYTYSSGLLTQVVYKKATVTVDTMTITYDTSYRPSQYSFSSGKVVNLTHLGTGFLDDAVTA